MESFGLWYKLQKQDQQSDCPISGKSENNCVIIRKDDGVETPTFDFHANFWSENITTKGTKPTYPYLDIGIKISKWRDLENITFHCPFEVKKGDLKDLTSNLKQQETEELVFNDTCKPEASGDYCIVHIGNEGNNNLLLYPLAFSSGDENMNPNVKICTSFGCEKESRETDLVIDFLSFQKLLINSGSRSKPSIQSGDTPIYIRFRIGSSELKNKIYFDSNPLNKSFETAFTKSRIVDFKLNEERNLSKYTRHIKDVEDSHLAVFHAIHFLIMEPSYYDVEYFSDKKMSCRELEEKQWNDYYGGQIDTDKEHVLAYHYSQKAMSGDLLAGSFSMLIKIKAFQSNWNTIVEYMLIVVVLGILGSALENIIIGICAKIGCTALTGAMISVVFGVGVGVVLVLLATKRKD